MLNPNAEKWVQALESGKYKQGTLTLHDPNNNTFCCLGVACEVFMENGGTLTKTQGEEGLYSPTTTYYNGDCVGLPPVVMEWLDMRSTSGEYDGPESWSSLMSDNDEGATFTEIAQTIRSEPTNMFGYQGETHDA